MRIQLAAQDGEQFVLNGHGLWLIGRATHAQICFPNDPYCPREAAHLLCDENGAFLTALSTSSPIMLNGAPVTDQTPLSDGAVLSIGAQTITVAITAPTGQATRYQPAGAATHSHSHTDAAPSSIAISRTAQVIGRTPPTGGIRLDHPSISRRHAELGSDGDGPYIRDLDSTNGTLLNSAPIRGKHPLRPGDQISIGPHSYRVVEDRLELRRYDESTLLDVRHLSIEVKNRSGGMLKILDDVSLSIAKSSFVCIVGSSGSGKSTLINAMSARSVPTTGTVDIKGLSLASHFSALRHDIAFVPQNNVLHESLTLRQALEYAAKLRLPPDLETETRNRLIEDAARAVDLEKQLDFRIGHLSGGQQKRASLASEILSSPSILFLDEVTSGLDEATDREIMALLRRRADDGMTVVCVTHTLANIESFCDTLAIMGRGGIPAFIGSPAQALTFFGVTRLGEIFDRLDERGAAFWRGRHEAEHTRRRDDRAADAAHHPGVLTPPRRASLLRQFAVLSHRNGRLVLADGKNLVMALVQSCLIGVTLGYAFSDFGDISQQVASKISLLMSLGIAALWLGTTTASTAIVSEARIFQREHDVDVSTIAFVVSKFVVCGLFTLVQIAIMFLLAYAIAEEIPGDELQQLGLLMLGALVGTGIGLTISAASNSQEQANTIVPLALIPQLVLAGVLVPALPEPGVILSKISISAFWMTEGMTDLFIAASDPAPMQFNAATGAPEALTAEPVLHAVAMLILHMGTCVAAAVGLALHRFARKS